ncbi:helix-turn-helix domain-containing protein [uncultured Hymenobacter sp.]|uniref:helix-turn-helix domain-containing protein n=1 Tax=uncultured Hymenobacter sp. TaxID=170016 RepID=UPI0035CB5AFF
MNVELLTPADLARFGQQWLAQVAELLAQQPGPHAGDLLDTNQVAAYTGFDRRVVKSWYTEGRFEKHGSGKRIWLPVHDFGQGLRFKRADVDAYAQGLGVTVRPQLLSSAEPPPKGKPTRHKKSPPQPSEKALRVA